MSEGPIVYVTHESNHDYTPAEVYGTVIFVTALDYSPIESSHRNQRLFSDIKSVIRKYRPGVDYVLSSGNPAIIGLFMMTLGAQFGNVQHNFLRWDRHAEGYVSYRMNPLSRAA